MIYSSPISFKPSAFRQTSSLHFTGASDKGVTSLVDELSVIIPRDLSSVEIEPIAGPNWSDVTAFRIMGTNGAQYTLAVRPSGPQDCTIPLSDGSVPIYRVELGFPDATTIVSTPNDQSVGKAAELMGIWVNGFDSNDMGPRVVQERHAVMQYLHDLAVAAMALDFSPASR